MVGPRSRPAIVLDAVSVGAFGALFATTLARLGDLPPLGWLPALLAAALVGVALADLGTGIVHWFCDRFFEEDTPWIGPALIAYFREHHREPQRITERGVLVVSGNNALTMLPVLASLVTLAPGFGGSLGPSLAIALGLPFAFVVAASNWFHRWAHQRDVPALVAALQRRGLLLSARHHGRHHRRHDRAYCVATGWCNPLLDRFRVWDRIEQRVRGRVPISEVAAER